MVNWMTDERRSSWDKGASMDGLFGYLGPGCGRGDLLEMASRLAVRAGDGLGVAWRFAGGPVQTMRSDRHCYLVDDGILGPCAGAVAVVGFVGAGALTGHGSGVMAALHAARPVTIGDRRGGMGRAALELDLQGTITASRDGLDLYYGMRRKGIYFCSTRFQYWNIETIGDGTSRVFAEPGRDGHSP